MTPPKNCMCLSAAHMYPVSIVDMDNYFLFLILISQLVLVLGDFCCFLFLQISMNCLNLLSYFVLILECTISLIRLILVVIV